MNTGRITQTTPMKQCTHLPTAPRARARPSGGAGHGVSAALGPAPRLPGQHLPEKGAVIVRFTCTFDPWVTVIVQENVTPTEACP